MKYILTLLISSLAFSISVEKIYGDRITITNDNQEFIKGQKYYFKGNNKLVVTEGILTAGSKSMLKVIKGAEYLNEGSQLFLLKLKEGVSIKTESHSSSTTSSSVSSSSLKSSTSSASTSTLSDDSDVSGNKEIEVQDTKEVKSVISKNISRKNTIYGALGYVLIGKLEDKAFTSGSRKIESKGSPMISLGYRRDLSEQFFLGISLSQSLKGETDYIDSFGTNPKGVADIQIGEIGPHAGYRFGSLYAALGFQYMVYGYESDTFNQEISLKGFAIKPMIGYEHYFDEKFGLLAEGFFHLGSFSKGSRKLSSGQVASFSLAESISLSNFGLTLGLFTKF